MKLLALSLLSFTLTSSALAWPTTSRNRIVLVETPSPGMAAGSLLFGDVTMIRTKSTAAPWLRFTVVHADLVQVIPPTVPVRWKEFAKKDSALAAAWFTYYVDHFPNAGVVTTNDNTFIVWWF